MFRNFFRAVVVLSMFAAALGVAPAVAQKSAAGLEPHVDLGATFTHAAGTDTGPNQQFNTRAPRLIVDLAHVRADAASARLFPEEKRQDGGWKGLARLLEAITPDIDTGIPLTPSQITDRINTMLDQGQNEQALDIIEKRIAQRRAQQQLGTDVQLMFLHARALAALGRGSDAISLYLDMTTYYPELPEPWNNLAAEYVKQDKLDMARDALAMALTADPHYAEAQANLGRVQLMLAERSFDKAAGLGISQARVQSEQTQSILTQTR